MGSSRLSIPSTPPTGAALPSARRRFMYRVPLARLIEFIPSPTLYTTEKLIKFSVIMWE